MIPNENFFFIRFATLFVAVYNKLAYEFRKNVRTINKRNFFYRCLSLVSLNYEKKNRVVLSYNDTLHENWTMQAI